MCFVKQTSQRQVLGTVRSHNVLGLVIEDNLRWNEHICMIVRKASASVYILSVFSDVEVASLLLILLLSTSLSYLPC